MSSVRNIFAIYTSEDKGELTQVLQQLKPLKERHNLTIWDDNPIQKGEPWKPSSATPLKQADIFLLLLSNTFMHSEFVQQLEFKTVIDQYKAGNATVIPVILETCPWDIDFEADEYTFNFKELEVLPLNGKPLKDWDSSKNVYKNVAQGIASTAGFSLGDDSLKETEKSTEQKVISNKVEEQTEIPFDAEKETEKAKINLEETEAKDIDEAEKLQKEKEAQNKANEAKRLKEKQEAKLKKEKELKRQKEAEERRLKEQRKAEKLAELERLQQEELKIQEEKKRKIEEQKQKVAAKTTQEIEEMEQEIGSGVNKRLLFGAIATIVVISTIWIFNRSSEDESEPALKEEMIEIEDSAVLKEQEAAEEIEEVKKVPLKALKVGELYEGAIVCSFDSKNGSGVLVQLDDSGPMTWKNAMQIHEKLGEGWRLPTLEELKQLRNTVGQGADNVAEFSDGLYWSATKYDAYQARLLRFRDGNTSYHYNKEAEHRKFRVRAIRNFSRE